MSGKTLTGDQYAKFQKLLEKEEKQKKYQQRLNAKITLQANWAKLHGCPVDSEHAEYYLGLSEPLRETMTVDQIIDAAEKAKSQNDEASTKKEGTEEPSLADETEEEELDA